MKKEATARSHSVQLLLERWRRTEMSLTMTDKYHIKWLYEKEGLTYKEIEDRTGHCYRTIKRYVESDDLSQTTVRKPREPVCPVLEPCLEMTDRILEEDRNVHRKQRHTARAIHTKLKEAGFSCSYESVKRYVRKKREQMNTAEVIALPLKHRPGSSQADFGEAWYTTLEGHKRKAWLLNASFPYSNRVFPQLLPSQNALCLFEGLRRIFEFIGGVPAVIRFDNMSTAVAKVGKGRERQLTDEFMRFQLHYGFECEFCAPAAPQSKGHVENMVGYVRRNTMAGEPTIADLHAFNDELFRWSDEDAQRVHFAKNVPQNELWQEERQHLLDLPRNPLDVFDTRICRADGCGIVRIDGCRYGVGENLQKKEIEARIRWDSVELYHNGEKIVRYNRSYVKGEEQYNPVLLIQAWIRKPAAMEETRHFDELPPGWRNHLSALPVRERPDALSILRELLRNPVSSSEACDEALACAGRRGRIDRETVMQFFWQKIHPGKTAPPIERFEDGMPSVSVQSGSQLHEYDKLFGGRTFDSAGN